MKKKTDLLIIDDEKVIIDSIIKISGLEGWSVEYAEEASAVIEKLDLTRYRLIICDIMMPKIDGFQFLNELEIRKIKTPVIMITGYTTLENAVKSLQQGAIDFIPKPFTVDELLSVVMRGLRYSDLQKEITTLEEGKNDSNIFVSCPPKYSRLAWISWVEIEKEGTAIIGVTDLFLKTIGSIKKIELLEFESRINQGSVCASIHTEDDLSYNLLSPVSGKIIERNKKVIENNKLPEKDPYFNGWLYRIIPADFEYEKNYLIMCSSDRI